MDRKRGFDKEGFVARLDRLVAELQSMREELLSFSPEPEEVEDDIEGVDAADYNSIDALFETRASADPDDFFAHLEEVDPLMEVQEQVQACSSGTVTFRLQDRLSLLDKFLFANELFGANQAELKNVLSELERMSSMEQVLDYLHHRLEIDTTSDAGAEFLAFIEANAFENKR